MYHMKRIILECCDVSLSILPYFYSFYSYLKSFHCLLVHHFYKVLYINCKEETTFDVTHFIDIGYISEFTYTRSY